MSGSLEVIYEKMRGGWRLLHSAVHSVSLPLSVVDSISKAWRVHNSEFEFHTFLLDANGTLGDFHCFGDPFCMQGKQWGKYTIQTLHNTGTLRLPLQKNGVCIHKNGMRYYYRYESVISLITYFTSQLKWWLTDDQIRYKITWLFIFFPLFISFILPYYTTSCLSNNGLTNERCCFMNTLLVHWILRVFLVTL